MKESHNFGRNYNATMISKGMTRNNSIQQIAGPVIEEPNYHKITNMVATARQQSNASLFAGENNFNNQILAQNETNSTSIRALQRNMIPNKSTFTENNRRFSLPPRMTNYGGSELESSYHLQNQSQFQMISECNDEHDGLEGYIPTWKMKKKIQMRPDHKKVQKQTNMIEQQSLKNDVTFQISSKNLQSPENRDTNEQVSQYGSQMLIQNEANNSFIPKKIPLTDLNRGFLRSRIVSPSDYEKADIQEASIQQSQSQFLVDDGTAAIIREQAQNLNLSLSPLNVKRNSNLLAPLKNSPQNTAAFMTAVQSSPRWKPNGRVPDSPRFGGEQTNDSMLKLPPRRKDKLSINKRRDKQMIAERKAQVIQMMEEGNLSPVNRDQSPKDEITMRNFKLPPLGYSRNISSTPGKSVTNTNTYLADNQSMPHSRGVDMSEIAGLVMSREMSRESDEDNDRPVRTAHRIGLPNIVTQFQGEYDVNKTRIRNVSQTNVTEVAPDADDDRIQREFKSNMMFNDLNTKLQKAKNRGKDFFDANAESSAAGGRDWQIPEKDQQKILEAKNKALIQNIEAITQLKSVTSHMDFSANTGVTKFVNNEIFKNPMVEQFFCVRPEVITITKEQEREIQNTFELRDTSKAYTDSLLMSLAKIKQNQEKKNQREKSKEDEQLKDMVNLLIGAQKDQNVLMHSTARKINNRMYSKLYKLMTQDEEQNTFKKFQQEVSDKRTYMNLCKQFNNSCIETENKQNFMFQYFMKCKDNKIPPLPILFKILNKRLKLDQYVLSKENTAVLSQILIEFPDILEKINFCKNGIRDKQMAQLIDAFSKLQRFSSFVIKHNEFQTKSMDKLVTILERDFLSGNSLEELKIISCTTTSEVMTKMLHLLVKDCNLTKLALVEAQLHQGHVLSLKQILMKENQLKELDLSFNAFTPEDMLVITSVLANNKKITNCNLSWNYLTKSDEKASLSNNWKTELFNMINQTDDPLVKKTLKAALSKEKNYKYNVETAKNEQVGINLEDIDDESFKRLLAVYEKELAEHEEKSLMKEHNAQIIANLAKFIKRNKKLTHINIDATQLTEYMLYNLCRCLTRSVACCVLHASGNPGITPNLREFLWRRVRAKDIHEKRLKVEYNDKTPDWQKELVGQPKREKIINENFQVSEMRKRALDNGSLTQVATKHHDNTLIFSRYLGHSKDIPKSGQWQLLRPDQKCWICEDWTYTLFFWSKKTGLQADRELEGAEDEKLVQNLAEMYKENNISMEFDRPYLMSPITNWKPQPFMTVKEFCFGIEGKEKEIILGMQDEGIIRPDLLKREEFNEDEERELQERIKLTLENGYNMFGPVVRSVFENIVWKNLFKVEIDLLWDHSEKYLQEEKIKDKLKRREKRLKELESGFKENGDPISPTSPGGRDSVFESEDYIIDPVYVFPCFLKPGKQQFLVGDELGQFHLHKFISPQRIDPIQVVPKEVKTIIRARTFDRHSSVFRDWKIDTKDLINDSLEHDFSHWKLGNIVKDEIEQMKVKTVFKKYGEFLKNLFIVISSHSNFPQIVLGDLVTRIAAKWNVVHKSLLPQSWLETYMIAASTNDIKFDGGKRITGQLTRFEFMETILRIAYNRFVVPKLITSTAEAVQKLIEEHIMPNEKGEQWADFREEKLWKLDVNDVLENNIEALKILHKRYHTGMNKAFNFVHAKQLLLNECQELGVKDTNVLYCWGMSHMTTKAETSKFSNYDQVSLVEFLEFLGRIADITFTGELDLSVKISNMLKPLLSIVGKTYKQPEIEVEEDSQSDEDY